MTADGGARRNPHPAPYPFWPCRTTFGTAKKSKTIGHERGIQEGLEDLRLDLTLIMSIHVGWVGAARGAAFLVAAALVVVDFFVAAFAIANCSIGGLEEL